MSFNIPFPKFCPSIRFTENGSQQADFAKHNTPFPNFGPFARRSMAICPKHIPL